MPSVSTTSAAFIRLQENLRLGLTCVKDLWNYEARDWVTGVHAADINQDGDIEVLAASRDGRVRSLTRDGRTRWEKVIGEKRWVTALAACSPSAEVQGACVVTSTADGKIYVLNQQGEEILPPNSDETASSYWFDVQQNISQMWMDTSQPLSVVFAADDRFAYCFDVARNQLRWRFSTPANDPIRAIFTCDMNGDGLPETLVGSDNQNLYLLSATGDVLATRKMDQAIFTLYASDIDKDGKMEILVGTRTKKLFALTADLQEKWVYELSSRPLTITVADVNNDRLPEILVACDDKSLSILDNLGKLVWRQALNQRYHSLNAFDLDRDGHIEVLAGADDSRIYAFRIQLSKGLDKKIRRDYTTLGKPDITTLLDLTKEQLELLLGVLSTTYGGTDKKLSLALAKAQLEEGSVTASLLSLLKLDQQRFQLLWEKERMGYHRALCLADLAGDKKREVVVSSRDGGLSIFNAKGRLLWSEKPSDGSRILDAQSGYLSPSHGEELAFSSEAGSLSIVNVDKTRQATVLQLPEPVACFYILAPSPQSASELLVGTKSGKAYLYNTTFDKPQRTFDLSATIQRVYASDPDEGGKYRNPELLMSTSDNVLFAYTRGGNRLWTYLTRSRIRALCSKDLDGDGRLEVLVGTNDRNIYVLDDEGNLRWRYVLYHSVLALETADIDNDGQQEILAGCEDGILYVFTATGDLIWRYDAKDPIQALRVGDIDLDENFEIVMVEENRLEVLQVVNQQELAELMAICWEHLLTDHEPLDALFPLIKSSDPYLRAAGLAKLAELTPLPGEAFDLFRDATDDAFNDVRKVLPAALMRAYPGDPPYARQLLNILFTDRLRDVRIEVVEHLELLVGYDWNEIYSYLGRALDSDERNTRRAALRKISRLLNDFAPEIKRSPQTHGEALFKLLLIGAQDRDSKWVQEEAGRVLADFLNLFEEDSLFYLYRLFATRLELEALNHTAYNLRSTPIRQIMVNLLALKFDLEQTDAVAALAKAQTALKDASNLHIGYSTDLWLIYRELLELFTLSSIEDLAAYDFRIRPEQFQTAAVPYPHTNPFLHLGDQLNAITRPLKMYLHRRDPNDRLSILLESINALDIFQRLVDREYGVSPLPGAPKPYLPEFIVLKALGARWQELFNSQRNELRGHPELQCELQSRTVHMEEPVGIWLQIANSGRAPAHKVKVTLLSDDSFISARLPQLQIVEIDVIPVSQDTGTEFLIKPLADSVTLTFEVTFEDAEHKSRTILYQDRLDFVEHPQTFTPIENPYTNGTPLHDGRMCYGREAPLAYLRDNLTRTSAQTVLVLYGQRRSGKTTLLNQLTKTDLLTQHVAVMIDLQNLVLKFTLNKFFFNISYLIYKEMHKKGLPVSEPLRKDFYGPSEDPMFSFQRFLDNVETFLGESYLILLFDEFEELEELIKADILQPEIFKYLRSLMQERPYIHFLLSGTQQIEKLTRDYWSVFFNITQHYRLPGKISTEGATELITRPVAGFLEYEPQVVNKIRALTADQPYLIHLVCRALIDHCNEMRKNYATINDVNLVREAVLQTGSGHFEWLWKRFEEEKAQRVLLQAIAEGSREEGRPLDLDDIKEVYKEYHYPYQPSEVLGSLKMLLADDVVIISGGEQQERVSESARYSLANGLFRQWLRDEKPLGEFKRTQEQPALPDQVEPALPDQEELTHAAEHQSNGAHEMPYIPTPAYSPDV